MEATATLSSYKDIAALVADHDLPIGGTNEDGEFVMITAGRTEEGLGKSYQVETVQNNGVNCIHTFWEDGTKEETFRHNDDIEAIMEPTGQTFRFSDDECFFLFGAIQTRLKEMQDVLEEPSARNDGRFEAAELEIKMLNIILKKLGF